jgi:outer membrane protein
MRYSAAKAVLGWLAATLLAAAPLSAQAPGIEGPGRSTPVHTLAASTGGATGIPAPSPGAMSLSDCLRTALEQNPSSRAADEASLGAGEAAEAAKAPYYPSLGFNAGYSRWQRRLFLPEGLGGPGMVLPTILGPENDWTLSLSAVYTLFDGGERRAQLGMARARMEAARAHGSRIQQDVALSVCESFYGLMTAEQNRDVARENLARAEDHVRLARARKEVGAVPLADVLRAEVQAAEAKLALVRADNALRVAAGRLNTSMGLPPESALAVHSEEAPVTPPDVDPAGELDRAVETRPEVKSALQGVEASRRSLDSARSAFAPKVSLGAAYGREDTAWVPFDKTWTAGVTLAIPIFTGFSRVHNVAKARADLARSEADLQQVKLTVRQQAWEAYSSCQEAYEAVQAAKSLEDSAKESLRYAKERYEVGAGSITDLLDAQTALAKAEASMVDARWSYRTALARYHWSTGAGLP